MKYDEAKQLFEDYVKDFDLTNEKVKYKYEHSYRVADISLDIANHLDISDDKIELAHACGMLHDIGRFYQVTQFNTYHDLESLDHGDMGYKVLKDLNVDNEIVLKSTKFHNKRSIPDDLTEEEKFYLGITRDADKIDILRTQCLDVPDDNLNITDDVYNTFFEKELTVDKTDDHTTAMSTLRCVSFVFDMNTEYGFKLITEENLILSKLDNLIKICDDERLLKMKELVIDYINERISD